ncbi:MAG: SMEK domain-containing protein [Bacteroidetes bacterium]|nr:SMEK domain-containing protein [Bacteroidota bacterium]
MNTVYGLNLKNLNALRSNNPGLDLGDESKEIAFQVSSQKTSTKINETLEKITKEQIALFKKVKVLIIGEKQNSYTLNKKNCKKCNFNEDEDIVDINSLLRI